MNMDIKEYDKWVNYVENNGFKLPDIIIEMLSNYNSWNSRLMTSRWVARWGNHEASLEIIEDTLDTISIAYEKLLDDLFHDIAFDISTDISMLETMLSKEGLTDNGFKK